MKLSNIGGRGLPTFNTLVRNVDARLECGDLVRKTDTKGHFLKFMLRLTEY